MTYTFSGTATNTPPSGNTASVSLSIGATANPIVIVGVSPGTGFTGGTLTVGGQSATLIGSDTTGITYLFWLTTTGGLSGTQTISFTATGLASSVVAFSVWYTSNVITLGTAAINNGTTGTLTVSVTSGQFMFAMAAAGPAETYTATETPANNNLIAGSSENAVELDWTIINTNAAFAITNTNTTFFFGVAAPFTLSPPVVNNITTNEVLPTTPGTVVAGVTASNNPTSFALTNGNFDAYYAINAATGVITAAQAAVQTVTNLLPQSQSFENTTAWGWGGFGVGTITTAATTAPDGTTTGELINEGTTATTFWRLAQQVTGTVNTTYTITCFLKAQVRTRAYLQLQDAASGGFAIFDLAGGVVGVGPTAFGTGWTNMTAQIFPVGNSWYRCEFIATTATSTVLTSVIGLDAGSGSGAADQSYTGAGAGTGIYAWGAQLEKNNTFGPYVHTTTQSATQTSQPLATYTLTVQATNSAGSGTGTVTITGISPVVSAPPLSWWQDFKNAVWARRSAAQYDTSNYSYTNISPITLPTFPHSVVSGATGTSLYLLNDVQVYALTVPLTWFKEWALPYPIRLPANAALRNSMDLAFLDFQTISGSVPVVTSGTFTENLPITPGTVIVTFQATSSPTSWTITNGNYAGYFALANTGALSATAFASQAVTNFILQSQTLQTSPWSSTGAGTGSPFGTVTVTVNTTTAPDGTLTGDLLGEGTTANFYRITQSVSATPSTPNTLTCYLKAQNRTRAYLQLDDNVGNGAYAIYDLAGGQIGVAPTTFGTGFTAATASLAAVGAGWYRCRFTATSNAASSTLDATIGLDAGSGTGAAQQSYTGIGVGTGIYAWGAQLEEDVSAFGPYVVTTTTSVSQSAQPAGTYQLTVTAANTVGTSAAVGETISAILSAPPVVTNQNVNVMLPLTSGQQVTIMFATNSPTNWAITAGNTGTSFAIDNTGTVTVTAAGAGLNTAQTFTMTVQATNPFGSGTGTLIVNVQTTGQPPVVTSQTFTLPT